MTKSDDGKKQRPVMASQDDATAEILAFLQKSFGDDLSGVYGIGSAFESSLVNPGDKDVVVLLHDTAKCPKKEWTSHLYEKRLLGDTETWLFYGMLDDYLDKGRFERTSFASWEWAVRSLKYCSTLLHGTDVRDELPMPAYDYKAIFLRVAYHLEPTPLWKELRAKARGRLIDEQYRFSKAVFKFGFFLGALYYPDANVFDKQGVYDLLNKAVQQKKILDLALDYYGQALQYRAGTPFPDFKKTRREFAEVFFHEARRGMNTGWSRLQSLLRQGLGKASFSALSYMLSKLLELEEQIHEARMSEIVDDYW